MAELYFKPKNVDELVTNVKLVAQAAPALPVFYYHFPAESIKHASICGESHIAYLQLQRHQIYLSGFERGHSSYENS